MRRQVWGVLVVPAQLLALLTWGGPTRPSCVPIEPEAECLAPADCEGRIHPECVGAWTCVDGTCSWECRPEAGCYSDADCPDAHHCEITNECCRPPGCGPDDVCIDLCVPCGECRRDEGECLSDDECPPGHVCVLETWCPPCTEMDPPCAQPCYAAGHCAPRETPCADTCDCYDAGIPFLEGCAMMCPLCDSFWSCENGVCSENCGAVPQEVRDCRL